MGRAPPRKKNPNMARKNKNSLANLKPCKPGHRPPTNPFGPYGKHGREFVEATREYTPEALAKIVDIMRNSENEKLQLDAAKFLIERGHGRAPQTVHLSKAEDWVKRMTDDELDEAMRKLMKGEKVIEAKVEDK